MDIIRRSLGGLFAMLGLRLSGETLIWRSGGMASVESSPVNNAQQLGRPWVAYAAAVWAAVFAAFHIIWAAGRYPLLDAEQARIAFATPWKWTYDVAVAAVCVIAVPVALAPVMSWGRYVPRRLTFTLATVGSALLTVRAAASLVQMSYFVATGQFRFAIVGIWEPWFYLGAILFTLSTWRSRRVRKTAEPPDTRCIRQPLLRS